MKPHHFYKDMMFSANTDALNAWMPLVMEGRKNSENVAATYVEYGTDVDFGALTRGLLSYLVKEKNVKLYLNAQIKDIDPLKNGKWKVEVIHQQEDKEEEYTTDFVFIGAGGGALRLLDKSDIEEADGYGGFPVSGLWLRCTKPEVIEKHWAKVYGKAGVGTPPMSVPHLDTRMIQGKKALLFGPFAGFTTKFLKKGSVFDLIKSLEFDNIIPVLSVGWNNWELTKYLIQQARLSHEDRIEALQKYYPLAKAEDWEMLVAGHRVQIIKKDKEKGGGKLEFGTEIIHNKQGTVAALLGASPGASTAVSAMLEVIQKCFPEYKNWEKSIQHCIPSYGQDLSKNPDEYQKLLQKTNNILL
jgi:malate dehydrogenase (quinone)